jgi:hypothetical protein
VVDREIQRLLEAEMFHLYLRHKATMVGWEAALRRVAAEVAQALLAATRHQQSVALEALERRLQFQDLP